MERGIAVRGSALSRRNLSDSDTERNRDLFVCIGMVRRFDISAPAVDAAHAAHGAADRDHGAHRLWKLLTMGGGFQLLRGIGQRGEGERFAGGFQRQRCSVPAVQGNRARVGMAAALLRDKVSGDLQRPPFLRSG